MRAWWRQLMARWRRPPNGVRGLKFHRAAFALTMEDLVPECEVYRQALFAVMGLQAFGLASSEVARHLRMEPAKKALKEPNFDGVTVIAWWPQSPAEIAWRPWSEAKSYGMQIGPLHIERYFHQRVEDGAGIGGPKLVMVDGHWSKVERRV